jgi:hypothetical protein
MDNKQIVQQVKIVTQAIEPLVNYLLSVEKQEIDIRAADLIIHFEISDSGYFFSVIKNDAVQ